jgi:prepilin-type processing-associated H-X9-DG protein
MGDEPDHTGLILLLPYLEQQNLIDIYNFNLRQYDPRNARAVATQINAYVCPSDDAAGRMIDGLWSRSNVVLCWGSQEGICNSCQIGPAGSVLAKDSLTDGAFQMDISRRLEDFTDGTSSTALASEEISGEADYRGGWTLPLVGSSYEHWDTPNSSNGDVVEEAGMCVVDGPDMPCGPVNMLSYMDHTAARSHHLGGVNVVFADGHVSFIPDTIDLAVWRALGSRNSGTALKMGNY